jgi:DNA-binding CsgD family transcriptional regulator
MEPMAAADLVVREVAKACRAGNDVPALQSAVLRSLRRVMPVDAAAFMTADPETLLFTGWQSEVPLDTVGARFLANELAGGDVNQFVALARSSKHVSSLDAVTSNDRMSSPRYRDIMRPIGLGDELRAALVIGSHCWGYLCLHREDGDLGFTASEHALITRLVPELARALRHAGCLGRAASGPAPRAGVVILNDALDLVACTPEAQELLSDLAMDRSPGFSLSAAVFAAAAVLKDQERSLAAAMPPRARVLARTGHWLDVQASRLLDSVGERRIAVVIEPAQRQSVVDLVLMAYGLSDRERQVATLVLRGDSTTVITAALHISAHTVQDHLKAVFDKTGVRSRRELIALLLTGHSQG